jgi:hypothetical protein
MSDNSSVVQILFSVLGAEAVTGAMGNIQAGSANLASELLKLGGVALTLNSAFDGLKGAMDFGSQMEILAARTGQTVRDMVVLGRAFEMAGMGADNMGLMINRLQKAISGVNEMGKPTKSAFAALGLDAGDLQGKSFEDQLTKLAEGFARIPDAAQRSAVAMDLFGRSGGQMLMLLTKEGLLKNAADDTGRFASRMQDLAPKFHDADNALSLMGSRMKEMWSVAVEQWLPVLTKIGEVIKGLNLAPLGAALSTGGAVVLATGVASALATKLDSTLYQWAVTATKQGETFAGTFLLPFSSGLANLFQTALPPIIIAAVAGAIIIAIAQGVVESINKIDAMRQQNAKAVSGVRTGLLGAEDESQYDAARRAGLAQRDKLQAELESTQKNAPLAAKTPAWLRWGMPEPAELTEYNAKVDSLKQSIAQINQAVQLDPNKNFLDATKARDAAAAFAKTGDNIEEIRKKLAESQLSAMSGTGKRNALQQRMDAITGHDSSRDPEATRDLAQIELLRLQKEYEANEHQITSSIKESAEATYQLVSLQARSNILSAHTAGNAALEQQRKVDLIRIEAEHKNLTADQTAVEIAASNAEFQANQQSRALQKEREAMQTNLNALKEREGAIQRDYTKTDAEKWPLLRKNLDDQIAAYDKYIARLKTALALEDPKSAHADALTKEIGTADRGEIGVKNAKAAQGPDPQSFSANWTKALTGLRQQWQMTSASIAQTASSLIGGAVNTISQGLTNVIMHAKTLGEAFRDIGSTILTSVVQAIVQMGVQFVATRLMMAVFGKAMAVAELATALPVALATSTMWAGPAALAVMATMGGAAAAAPGEIMASMMATRGLALAESGGYFPGQDGRVAGIFHGNEFVFSAPAVRAIGPQNLAAMHSAATSPSAAKAAGGAAGRTGNRPVKVINVLNMRDAMKEAQRDPGHEVYYVDLMKRRRGEILES